MTALTLFGLWVLAVTVIVVLNHRAHVRQVEDFFGLWPDPPTPKRVWKVADDGSLSVVDAPTFNPIIPFYAPNGERILSDVEMARLMADIGLPGGEGSRSL